MRNAVLFAALRVTARLMPFVPLSALYALATAAGTLAYFVVPGARRGIYFNLEVALPELPRRRRSQIARSAFCNDAKNWVDTLRIAQVSLEDIRRDVRIEGHERLRAALEAGRGAIMVTMHLGNFDLVGQWLGVNGYQLTIPVERMNPPELFEYLVHLRGSRGINVVPVDRGPRELIRALRRNEIAGVAGDRDFTGHTVEVPFFGRPARIPGGPARLARHTGAPLLLGVGVRTSIGRYEGVIHAPLEMQRTADAEADVIENTTRIAHALEPFVRAFPEQWLAFSPIWDRRTAGDHLATIEQHEKAAV